MRCGCYEKLRSDRASERWDLLAGRTIIAALNTASGVKTRRGFLRRRVVALLIVSGGAVLILGALLAIASLAWIERILLGELAAVLGALRAVFWIGATGGAVAALALVYRYAPNRPPPAVNRCRMVDGQCRTAENRKPQFQETP